MPFFDPLDTRPARLLAPISHHSTPRNHPMRTQATSLWRQSNHAEARAASRGCTLLRVNLDETAVCLFPGRGKGAVFLTRADLSVGRGQKVAKWKRRCYMTHVGVLCDRPDVQGALPQFIVANERTLQVRALGALRRACPPNVVLVRQSSAWSNSALTARIIRAVAAAIALQREHLPRVQVLFFLDAAKIHLGTEVLRACRDAGVWLIVIPPRTTFCLQPLDSHVFALYKACLLSLYQDARARGGGDDGDLDMSEFLPCVYGAIRQVL